MSIALQVIDMLEKLHFEGYLHNDLKPDNIVIGKRSGNNSNDGPFRKLYLIDFGLTTRYLDNTGEHIKYEDKVAF